MADYDSIFKKITNAVLVDYLELFYIDLETDEYIHFSKDARIPGSLKGTGFFDNCRKDADKHVYEDDRERFLAGLSKENLINCIKNNIENSAEYRLILDGEPVWHIIRIIKGEYTDDDRYVILGVQNINEQKLASQELLAAEQEREKLTQIANALANIFDSIYYVDLSDNSFIEFSSSDQYKKIRTTDHGSDFFYLAKPLLSKFIHPNDVDKILCIHDKNEMLKEINRHKGAHTTEYRFIIKGAIYYCRAGIRITKDRSHVLVSITNLGREENIEKKLLESERLSVTFSQIAERLAEHYDSIYYVNINTDKYMTFSSIRLLSELNKTESENNFFENVLNDIDKVVYYEDRETVRNFFDKEQLLADLSNRNAKQLEYRRLIDGEPTYVRLIAMLTKDKENILLCVENINEQVLRYRALAKKATSDELTGAKNKNSYKEFEEKLNGLISSGEAEFAIVACDINNLKTINDTLGHSAGDEYIRSSCSLICNTYVHSPVFRVGGDEFIVIVSGEDYLNRDSLLKELQDKVENNVKCEVDPSRPVIATGMCAYTGDFKSVEDVFNEADQRMYENKRRLKSFSCVN
ncbi:MAG: diguanylate cyclase [Lachnospiraceae bacterium]|nr:diguanylate cyclase [Lachnospiraceae bacterium]